MKTEVTLSPTIDKKDWVVVATFKQENSFEQPRGFERTVFDSHDRAVKYIDWAYGRQAVVVDAMHLIAQELDRTRRMWGERNDDEYKNGELGMAAEAMIKGVRWESFKRREIAPPSCWPAKWDRKYFRDFGQPVWNLVVAATYLVNEIDRLIRAGHSVERIRYRDPQEKIETTRLPQDSEHSKLECKNQTGIGSM